MTPAALYRVPRLNDALNKAWTTERRMRRHGTGYVASVFPLALRTIPYTPTGMYMIQVDADATVAVRQRPRRFGCALLDQRPFRSRRHRHRGLQQDGDLRELSCGEHRVLPRPVPPGAAGRS